MSEQYGWTFKDFRDPTDVGFWGSENDADFTVVRCPVCLDPSTIIAGDFETIEEFGLHGTTIASNGGPGQVTGKLARPFDGSIVEIKGMGLLPLQATPEHPFEVVSRLAVGWTGRMKFTEYVWKKAIDLKPVKGHQVGTSGLEEDYLVMPRPRGFLAPRILELTRFALDMGLNRRGLQKLPVTPETAWMMGYYVAEGFTTQKEVFFTIGKNDGKYQAKLIQLGKRLGYSPYCRPLRTATYVSYPSRILARAFAEWFGRGASNKRIPDFILFNRYRGIVEAFFQGYWVGDGCFVKANGHFMASTVSRILASQLQLMAARLGYFMSIHVDPRRSTHIIENRLVNQRTRYALAYTPNPLKKFAHVRKHDILVPIRATKLVQYAGHVLNLETSSGTYLANNVVVHNCGLRMWVPRGHFDATHNCTIICPYSGDQMWYIPGDPSQAKDRNGNPITLHPGLSGSNAAEQLIETYKRYFMYCPSSACPYYLDNGFAFLQKRVEVDLQVGR